MVKEIFGFKDYFITDGGEVISKKWGKIKILRPVNNKKGYLSVRLSMNGKPIRKFIHRLVAEHFVEGYDDILQVNHIDGNKHNNHYSNLEWCSASENTIHAINIGLNTYCFKTPSNAIKVIDTETGINYNSLLEASKKLKKSIKTIKKKDRFNKVPWPSG
ncbi:MAG: HNH endonuclease [Candidatus Riesia sp.]|nr:HNH endonuclease [Candidatus Riesia sp.]